MRRLYAALAGAVLCACSPATSSIDVSPAHAKETAPRAPAPAAAPIAPPLAVAEPAQQAAAPLVRRTVQLTILGEFPSDVIPDIEAALRSQLRVHVLPTLRRELPEEAYYAPRKRYRAEKLLAALEAEQQPDISQLGMTEVDISTTKGKIKDWGILGLGSLGGSSSVISTFRTRRDQPSEARYRFRVVSTAVHEVGHMLGLDHCTEPRCVMNDAEGSIRTVDESTGELGPACRALLDERAPATLPPVVSAASAP